jgi:excisionase family DNA binding protein
MSFDEYLNVVEAAEYLGLTKQRIHQLAQEGRIGRRIAGHFVFTREELDEYRSSPKNKGGRPKRENDSS